MRVVALIAALLLVPAGASFAHVRSSQGYSDIRGGDGSVLYDLSLETAILEAAAGHGPAADYVLPRVQVFLDGVECEGEVRQTGVASRDGRDHTRMLLAYTCPGSSDGAYEIRYGAFADGGVVDDHANLATYRLGGASGTFVFDAGHMSSRPATGRSPRPRRGSRHSASSTSCPGSTKSCSWSPCCSGRRAWAASSSSRPRSPRRTA